MVPGFQELMLPLLQLAADRQEHTLHDSFGQVAVALKVSDEDQRLRLPSGNQTKFHNRVSWGITYLKKAGLLQSTGRGRFRITDAGLTVLKSPPARIDLSFLNQYPGVKEFRTIRNQGTDEAEQAAEDPITDAAEETPEERLEIAYHSMRRGLASEILERVRKCTPAFFERLVVELLVAMGYGGSLKDAGKAVGQSGDGGIDGIIKEDKLGLDAVYLQAKRWEAPVGRPVVQAFAGSLEGHRARKGVLISTSTFTSDAKDYVTRIEKRIVLIDGEQLAQFMIDHNVGVAEAAVYIVKKLNADYFEEE